MNRIFFITRNREDCMRAKRKSKSFVSLLLAFALVLTLIPVSYFGFSAKAEEVTPPAHSKTLTDNGDGTYDLNLSVTGSSTSSETKTKVNVVIVMDVSTSMTNLAESDTGRNGLSGGYYIRLYRRSGNSYTQLTSDDYSGTVYYRSGNSYYVYSGQRYLEKTKLEVAKSATTSLINTLAQNNVSADDDTIEITFETFSDYANTSASYYGRWYHGNSMTTLLAAVNNMSARGTTNWDDALHDATAVADAKKVEQPDEEIHYIFVTDGNPTVYMNANHTGNYSGTGSETGSNVQNSLTPALAEVDTIKAAGYHFYGVGVFGSVDRMQTLTDRADGQYYSAADETALNAAFASIIESITNAANFQNVVITDGVTEATSSVVLQDGASASDYRYTITDPAGTEYVIDLNEDGTIAAINGNTEDVTLTDTVGQSHVFTIGGAFPAASKSGNGVQWDLSSLGQLLNNYTYTVSFKVWPSQEAYDTLAALLNGTVSWDEVDQTQYVQLEGGGYGLRTNTEAKVSYDSVVLENGEVVSRQSGTSEFQDTPAMPLTSTTMDVEKKWIGEKADGVTDASVTLELYIDGEASGKTVVLNAEDDWKASVAIAPGLQVDGEILETGHSYRLEEVSTSGFSQYHYEFAAETVHPMLVDSATQIVDALSDGSPMTGIVATNIRKSSLSIDKAVTDLSADHSADPDQLFTYKITVTDSLDDEVWFSIGDGAHHTVVEESRVSGATAEKDDAGEFTGYYFAQSGSEVTVNIKAGENIYFINLPVGTTYEVEEIDIPKGYTNTAITNNGADAANEVPAASGTIAAGNTAYQVEYTNTYDAVTISGETNNALQVTKKVEGLDAIEQFTFTLTPDTETLSAIAAGDIVLEESADTAETVTEGYIKENGSETVGFGKYTFYTEGTYQFKARETTTTTAGGWTYDDSEAVITVTIAKDAGGRLNATVVGNNPVFTNSYEAAPVEAEIPVEKILSVSEGLSAPNIREKFTFTLEAVDGAPMPAEGGETVKNPAADGGTASFGAVTFTEPGTYTYTITETGEVEGVVNDTAAQKTVTVVVTDQKDGTMKAVVNGDVTTSFTNKYEVGEATAQIPVTKILTAEEGLSVPDITNAFTFTLEAVDGAPMPAEGGETVKNPAADGGTASFGTITFTQPGVYTYRIKETGSVAGVTNDAEAVKEIIIDVMDNGNGTMTAVVNGGQAVTFTNEYTVESAVATIPVTKVLAKSDPSLTAPSIAEEYTFTLKANDGAPMPAEGITEVKNPEADGGTASFGEITYSKPGTYTYTITESGQVDGITNDPAAESGRIVTVVVTDDGRGKLSAVVQGADTGSTSATTFTNTYSVQPAVENIPVTKVLDKEDPSLQAPDITGEYTFTIAAVNGAPTTDASGASITTSFTNPEADGGTVSFGAISFTKPGTYVYTVSESGSVDGITNDATSSRSVTVIVTDNADGTLSTEVRGADGNGRSTTFTNTYSVEPVAAVIPVTKVLDAAAGLTPNSIAEKFTFTIAAAEGSPQETPLPAETSVKNPEDRGGSADFGEITFTKPGTYTYTITETGSADGVISDPETTKTVTVTVTDNADGTLAAQVAGADGEGSSTTFTNSYAIEESIGVVIFAGKELSAEEGLTPPDITGKYTFTIAAAEGSPEGTPLPDVTSVTNPAADGGLASFDEITFTEPGTYTYTITESGEVDGIANDTTSVKTVVVIVTDKGDGTLSAESTSTAADPVTFINTYEVEPATAQIPVEKILSVPEGLTAPDITEAYTFTLEAVDGAPMPAEGGETVKNPEADGGLASFGEITFEEPGSYTYTVTESGSVDGVANDSVTTKTVTVEVTDNSDGTLTALVNGGQSLQFTNSYSVGEISVTIPVSKILNAEEGLTAPDITAAFTFTLTDADGNEIQQITNPAAKGGSMSFAAITYDRPGSYTYTVTETGSVDGVANDQEAAKTVTVVVTDNSDGTMSALVNGGEEVVFENTYSVEEVTADIPVEKILGAEDGLQAPDITGAYTFVLSVGENSPEETPLPETTMLRNPEADGGSMRFGAITYDKPGSYTYTVTETGSVDGVTNDQEAVKTVTVVVTDNSDGTLTAAVNGADRSGSATTFTNTYAVESIDVQIPVTKILEVEDDLTAPDITGAFTFTLKDAEGNEIGQITNPAADGGEASFAAITYDKPGTYTYTVTEAGSVEGITNDPAAERVVEVVITDEGDGTLFAQVNAGEAIEYTNTYEAAPATAQITVDKILEVPAGLTAPDITGAFTFTLEAVDGAPMPAEGGETVTNPEADGGEASFAAITYDRPGTYTYTVTETGTVSGISNDSVSTRTVTVVVTDNSDGTLSAVVNGGETVKFTNSYSVGEVKAAIPVTKILQAGANLTAPDITGAFTFTLTDAEGNEIEQITNPAADGGTAAFSAITFTEPGTYTYTVTETGSVDGVENDAEAVKTITVVVTDNSDGTMTALVNGGRAVEFTNTYKVSETAANIPVEKILSVPEGLTAGSIAGKFTFSLQADEGTPMPESTQITNPDASGGTAVFDAITYTEPGTYTYTVTESGSADGVTNDQTPAKTVQVVVTDDGRGALNAVVNGGENLTFTNSYDVDPVQVTLPVRKDLYVPAGLEGPADISGKFTFTITGADEDTPLPQETQVTNPDADGGMAVFGEISYNRPGTYIYTVTESGNVSGITNDAQAASGKTVTVQVTDKGDGTLSASASTTVDEPLTFTNIYAAEPTAARITAVKKLKNVDLAQGAFNFELEAKTGGAPMPASSNASNDANGTIVFGEITFSQPGTYEYTVKETAGSQTYYEYSEDTYTVTVTVTDNRDGTLSSVVRGDGSGAVFTNTYLAKSNEVTLSAEKRVNGEAATANIFQFTITADDDGALPAETTVTNNGGSVSFGPIEYTADIFAEDEESTESATTGNAAEEEESKDSETAGDQSVEKSAQTSGSSKDEAGGMAGDESTENSEAASTGSIDNSTDAASDSTGAGESDDSQNGENTIHDTEDQNGTPSAEDAENASEGASAADNNLTGRSAGTAYRLIRTADVTESDEIQGSDAVEDASEADTAASAASPADQTGEETRERVRTFHYTISEIVGNAPGYTYDTRTQGVTVTVTDNGDGTLSTSVVYDNEDVSFNNLYQAEGQATIEAKKVLEVLDGNAQLGEGDFTFGLYEGDKEIARAANDADGSITFTLDYDEKDGGRHIYTVRELVEESLTGYTYDTATVLTAIVDVQDDGEGHMDTSVMYPDNNMTFTNTYEPVPTDIAITGTKVLKGRSLTAGEFVFELTDEKGMTVAAGTNDADGTITFTKIPVSRTGVYKYTAVEIAGNEAAMTYDSSRITFTVTVTDVRGELTVESIAFDQNEIIFTNSYDPSTGVEIEKHATNVPLGKKYKAGDTINYLITVTNVGNVPLTEVLVRDELTGDMWTLAVLQPGEVKSYEASYTVTEEDAGEGNVRNVAVVTAKTPDPNKPEVTGKDEDTELVKKTSTITSSGGGRSGRSARTGDDSQALVWIALLFAAAAAGAGVTVVRRREEKKEKEK